MKNVVLFVFGTKRGSLQIIYEFESLFSLFNIYLKPLKSKKCREK